jgi:hypothetical protein
MSGLLGPACIRPILEREPEMLADASCASRPAVRWRGMQRICTISAFLFSIDHG